MAAVRPLTVFDAYDRFMAGEKMTEADWDYKIIPMNAAAMKEKYNIKFGKEIVPEDKDLMNRLFQAGMEMLVTTGIFNSDLGRVMKVTEEEIRGRHKEDPQELGPWRIPRRGLLPSQGRATHQGSLSFKAVRPARRCPEEVFVQVMQSYAQEAVVDTLVNGVMSTIEGHPATTNTPWEIRAMMAELRAVREARIRANRPYMAI